MWITTKSIVEEIKKNQEDLAVKLDLLAAEQKENSSTLRNQIETIFGRLEKLEKICVDERENSSNQFAVLMKGLEGLKHSIGEVQDKICGTVKTLIDNCEHALIVEIESAKERSDIDREKYIAFLMDTIKEKIEQLEKEISEMINEVVLETKKCSNDITEEIESVSSTIQSVSSVAASKDAVMSDNIETMNHAMQEMVRNLLSLDEGNRLIIAKLLLKDTEI